MAGSNPTTTTEPKAAAQVIHAAEEGRTSPVANEKDVANIDSSNNSNHDGSIGHHKSETTDTESLEQDAQAGVRAIEAATSVWTRTHLWTAYAK